MLTDNLEARIKAFKTRAQIEPEFCLQLFQYATVRLLAHKYAYYVLSGHFIEDIAYDGEEQSWYVMGRALGLLQEHETSPCVDFDESHPLAKKGMELARSLRLRT